MVEKIHLLGLPISLSRSLDESMKAMSLAMSQRKAMMITFVNPHAYYLRAVDQGYANCLWHFDMVLADGIGVTKALRWISGETIDRQSFDGTSLFRPFFSYLNDTGRSVCIVGGRPNVAENAIAKMKTEYLNVKYLGSQDGFLPFDQLVGWVMAKQPDVLIIGMGAPIQEKLLLRLRQSGFQGIGITCGGFLDQYLDKAEYYPQFVDRLNIRFLYRLIREPKRLARRYLIEYQSFVVEVIQRLFNRTLFGN